MNWYTVFYLFSLADKISGTFKGLAIVATIIFGLASIIHIFGTVDIQEASDTHWRKVCRKWQWIGLVSMMLTWSMWAFIPDRNDMLVIIAGGAVGEFVTNDTNARQLPADITRFLRKEILEATMEEGNEAVREAMGLKSKKERLMEKSKEELIELLEQSSDKPSE